VLLHTLPLFTYTDCFAAINTVLASASGILLLPKFELPSALKHMSEVTVFMGVPTHYTRLLQDRRLNREATVHMRLFVSGRPHCWSTPTRNSSGVPSRDSRTLRHDRDADQHLDPYDGPGSQARSGLRCLALRPA